jgi:hypothetical protein
MCWLRGAGNHGLAHVLAHVLAPCRLTCCMISRVPACLRTGAGSRSGSRVILHICDSRAWSHANLRAGLRAASNVPSQDHVLAFRDNTRAGSRDS